MSLRCPDGLNPGACQALRSASLRLGGSKQGRCGLGGLSAALGPGRHELRFQLAGYEDKSTVAEYGAGASPTYANAATGTASARGVSRNDVGPVCTSSAARCRRCQTLRADAFRRSPPYPTASMQSTPRLTPPPHPK